MMRAALMLLALSEPAPDPTPHLPPLEDLELFAYTHEEVLAQLERHVRHGEWLEWRSQFSLCRQDRDNFAAWIAETSYRRQLWEFLGSALCTGFLDCDRREALQSLRFRLGATAYYCGQMPRPFPAGLPQAPPLPSSARNGNE